MATAIHSPLTTNKHLLRWVEKMADLAQPANIHWVDGSQSEYDSLCRQLERSGTFVKLNQDLWPGCFYARTDPGDVARVEEQTFICSLSKDHAGPTAVPSKLSHSATPAGQLDGATGAHDACPARSTHVIPSAAQSTARSSA